MIKLCLKILSQHELINFISMSNIDNEEMNQIKNLVITRIYIYIYIGFVLDALSLVASPSNRFLF